ncbi:MAG TPA: dihydrofolate reductase family protein [Pyrinomonadaceae bacterium]|jgi:dihydrofolate reductase
MAKQRKIIVSIATSADGYIARSDGSVDWLDRPQPPGNYGMGEFFKTIDTILWGSKTYGVGLEMDAGTMNAYGPKTKNYVFTHHPPKSAPPGFEFVNEPIDQFAQRLRAVPGKDIWMMGGGGIIASFMDAGEIDEFIIHVIPRFIGQGIPLIAPKNRDVPLKLLSVRDYPDGVVRLHYAVERLIKKKDEKKKKS